MEPTGEAERLGGPAAGPDHGLAQRPGRQMDDRLPGYRRRGTGARGRGPGRAIEMLARTNPSVSIAGIDHSQTMLAAASSRNREAVQSGHVHLELGSVMNLPFEDARFDKVFSINCIYFWEPAERGCGKYTVYSGREAGWPSRSGIGAGTLTNASNRPNWNDCSCGQALLLWKYGTTAYPAIR